LIELNGSVSRNAPDFGQTFSSSTPMDKPLKRGYGCLGRGHDMEYSSQAFVFAKNKQ
jgi:hypothetical protein